MHFVSVPTGDEWKTPETQELFPDRLMTFSSSVWEKRNSCPAFRDCHFLQGGSLEMFFFVFTFRFIDIENHKCRVSIRKMRRGRNKGRYISVFGICVVFLKVAAAI